MKLKANLKFASINVRREKEGNEEGPIAIDIGIAGPMQIDLLQDLFSTRKSFDVLLAKLYDESSGELVCGDLASMKLKIDAMNVCVTITTSELKPRSFVLKDCEFNEVKLEPVSGRVCDFKGRIQCKPSKEMLADLSQLLHETLEFDLSPAQSNLDLDSDDDAQEHAA